MNQNNGIISLLFHLLGERGISYAVLRNYETLPESPLKGSDVDILINREDKEKYFEILKEAAKETDSFIIRKIHQINYLSCLVYQKDSGSGFWIDACTEMSTKSFVWADSKFLLENRRKTEKGFFVIPPGAEAATIFVKGFFSGPEIKERYRLRIPGLAQNDKDSFVKTLLPYFGAKTSEEMFQICASGKWVQALKKRKGWFSKMALRNALYNPFYQFFRFLGFFLGVFRKNLSAKGALITFAGPDGVGKTTVCEKLAKRTENLFFKKISLYHGHFGFFPEWGSIYGKIFGKEKVKKLKESRRVEKTSFFYSVFAVLYYGLEYFISWPLVTFTKIRGGLMIFDRYFYDFATLNTNSKFPLRLFRNVAKFLPRPDVLFIMLARPEVIYERKKELTLEEIERQIKVFKNDGILKLAPAIFIDGEKSPDVILDEAEDRILKMLSRRIK